MVHLLKAPRQHRTVLFAQDILSDVHSIVRVHTEDVYVVRCMVDLAKREPVGNLGQATFVSVLENMRCVEEWLLAELTDGATLAIRSDHKVAEPVRQVAIEAFIVFAVLRSVRGCVLG